MKRFLSLSLAAILAASAVSCAAPTPAASATASDTAQYETFLAERGCLPDSLIIGTDADAKQYGVDMTAFADDGFFTRADGGNVVILAKTDAGIDRAVRDYAKNGNSDDYYKTYNAGPRVGRIVLGGLDIGGYTVSLPDTPTETENYAADEFIRYIALACGTQLEKGDSAHKIALIRSDSPELGDDGFAITVSDGQCEIVGGGYRGIKNGVYTFLEKYVGWRFFAYEVTSGVNPTKNDNYDFIYEADTVDIPAGTTDTEVPKFTFRYNYSGTERSRADKLKANDAGNMAKYGTYGTVNKACHGMQNVFYNVFDDFDWDSENKNPCFSSEYHIEAMREAVVAYAAARVAAGGVVGKDFCDVDVSHYDTDQWCNCKECQKMIKKDGSISGSVVQFANECADALAEDYPGLYVSMLAYSGADEPPKVTRPRENVQVSFCIYNSLDVVACYHHPIDGSECGDGAKSVYSKKIGNAVYARRLEGWCSMATRVTVWYYPGSWNCAALSVPTYENLRKDMLYLQKLGVYGVFVCPSYYPTEEVVYSYLMERLLWNADVSDEEYEDMVEEALTLALGDAGGYVKDYWSFTAHTERDGCWSNMGWSFPSERMILSEYTENYAMLRSWLECALLSCDTSRAEKLVRQMICQLDYIRFIDTYDALFASGDEASRAAYEKEYADFVAYADGCGFALDFRHYLPYGFDGDTDLSENPAHLLRNGEKVWWDLD